MGIASDLRQSVLQAAMQGKLTTQKAEDGDAKGLLLAIREEKEKLVKEKKGKKEKSLAPVTDEEIPFDIPDNWVWARLTECLDVRDGTHDSPKYCNKGYPLVTSKNLKETGIDFSSCKLISLKDYEAINKRSKVDDNDILFAMIGTIGNPILYHGEAQFSIKNMALLKHIGAFIDMEYAYWFLKFAQLDIKKKASGGVQNFVSLTFLRKYLIPLPPLPEQQRIVARVDALMKEIDELEQTEKELEAIKVAFPGDMKASLLQAAMEGKLTEQKAEDGDARGLLRAIREEKEKLVKEKKGKKEKPLAPITDEEIPFDIPENWVWCRLGEVGIFVRGNGIKRNEIVESSDYPCIRYGELYTTYHLKTNKVHSRTSKDVFEKAQKAHYGDILMALTGENNKDIALAVAYLGTNEVAYGGDMTVFHHHMEPMYLSYVINSFYFIKIKSNLAKGNIIVHISNDKLSTIPIPLPPLAEQHRIVEKLDQLLPLCDSLSEH